MCPANYKHSHNQSSVFHDSDMSEDDEKIRHHKNRLHVDICSLDCELWPIITVLDSYHLNDDNHNFWFIFLSIIFWRNGFTYIRGRLCTNRSSKLFAYDLLL